MPRDHSIQKVLVIGSGPIVIGQAAEFDYAGAQACRVLKAEGVNVVLANSNPATIMTDKHMADEIYLEPLSEDTIKRIIEKEKPDSLLAGLGGLADDDRTGADHKDLLNGMISRHQSFPPIMSMKRSMSFCVSRAPVQASGVNCTEKQPGYSMPSQVPSLAFCQRSVPTSRRLSASTQ